MTDSEIHVGDVLRVREWDDMVREFGVDEYGEIKHMCGKQVEVKNVFTGGRCGKMYECIFVGAPESDEYYFAADELESLPDEDWEIADDEEIKLLFG